MNKIEKLYNGEYFSPCQESGYPYGYVPEYRYLAKSLYQKFKPGTALDIGCATGNLVQRLVELGVDAYGIDVSEYAISQAGHIKNRLKQVDISSEKLPFQSNYFDLVTMLEVIEHVENEENIMNEINRLLRHDGVVYITTPTPEAPPIPEHINIHDKNYWLNLFEKHGFKAEMIKPLYSYTWNMANDRQKEWMKLPNIYKIKNRPRIMIKFIERLSLFGIPIFFINSKYKKFKNDRITYRFLLKKNFL